jgi:hypothetical protein
MHTTVKETRITEDKFREQFPLITNHLRENASWTYGEGNGCLFETYGEEEEFVMQQDPRCIWTLIEGDSGRESVISGFHRVNRIGYLISSVPIPENTSFSVRLESQRG